MKFHQKHPTTISTWAIAIAQTLKIYGHEPEDILKQAGIDSTQLLNPEASIRVSDMTRLWALSVKLTGDPCFGLSVAANFNLTTFHALGYALLASSSLFDAFERLKRYYKIISNAVDLKIIDNGNSIAISFETIDNCPGPSDEAFDAVMGSCILFSRMFSQLMREHNITISRIEFTRKEPEHSERFRNFFEVPVYFSNRHNRIHITAENFHKPLPTANPEIARRNDQIVADCLERFDRNHLGKKVHEKLIDLLQEGEPSLDKLAASIGMSRRNLSRYLQNENMTYKQILKETRKYLAAQYLNQPDLPVIEVSLRLGYSDPSNFTRAFKQWYGISPQKYRGKKR